jgi:hypothetical protein
MTMLVDLQRYPRVFVFQHPISEDHLDAWLAQRSLHIPDDLKRVWLQVGGGDMFESETLLAPLGDEDMGDDIDAVNRVYRSRGLSANYLVFHDGLGGLSVVRLSDGQYAQLDKDTFIETTIYPSFDEWYQRVLRAEYASRYGLEDLDQMRLSH